MTIIDRRYSVTEGVAVKAPCRAATTANITLGGLQTIDGVVLAATDRVLVKNQTDGTLNGIYSASTGNWLRERDFDGPYDVVEGTRIYIAEGSLGGGVEYVVTNYGQIVIGTTVLTFGSIAATAVNAAIAAAASATASAGSASASATSATASSGSATTAAGSASAAATSATASATSATASAASATATAALFQLLHVREEQTAGTVTTTPTTGSAWVKRTLNATKINAITSASLTSSVISLPAGTYDVEAACELGIGAAGGTNSAKTRLRDTTNSVTLAVGIGASFGLSAGDQGGFAYYNCTLKGRFTLTGTTNIEFQHYTTSNTNPPGIVGAAETEVWSDVMIRRVG